MTRDDLIQLVEKIQHGSGCITDIDALISQFENQVVNPSASRLIFDPPDGRHRSAEEIVEVAMQKSVGGE